MQKFSYILFLSIALFSCSSSETPSDPLFEEMSADVTHIDFVNQLKEEKGFNIFNYRNFYNGGGVAIGDINNDGLSDVFVTSNFEDNKLYLNKGNFEFEDISEKAGVKGKHSWSTGVTFADVNGDGFMDIYVCNSGNRSSEKQTDKKDRANELYINNGNMTFTEKAAEAGLQDAEAFSTHAAFFDYDRDGDLDMYLLNNSFTDIGRLNYQNFRNERDKLGGDKLFRNDSPLTQKGGTPHFTDVSQEAGIFGSLIGFGLGITIGDVNNDNWLDIYISNDFYERDYLYVNQKNGTFKEVLEDQMQHISAASMGADIADINNDGNLDIFVTDMLPANDVRLKLTSQYEGYDLFKFKLEKDYWYQYMQNNLHLNNGDGTFSEVARLAGVHATDWSWGALIFDMNNDGKKDVFVANGIVKDLTDQDYVAFLGDANTMQKVIEAQKFDYKEFVDKIDTKPVPNYAFLNEGNLKFNNKAFDLGLGKPSFSNGSAYGDLDNDGDIDLIVNNNNSPLGVFRNRSVEKNKSNFLRVKLKGTGNNQNGIGAKVYVHQKGEMQYLQQMPNRGFQSSSDLVLVFGLGENPAIDSLTVIWQDDKKQVLKSVKANQTLQLDYTQANQKFIQSVPKSEVKFTDITANSLAYKHEESFFVDYNRDALLKQMLSTQGPAMAVGDVNGDGQEDIFFGGAAGKPKKLFIQKNGKFVASNQLAFMDASSTEDTDAIFFDADGDKDLDLFVVTGSNEFEPNALELKDLLFLNDGKGNFVSDYRMSQLYDNGSTVAASDFDKDGDVDLFVGSRMIPGQYGISPQNYLLTNDGTGLFKNFSKRYMPEIESLGMVTDATWTDIDKDGYDDLVVVGDWSAIKVFKNEKGRTLTAQAPIGNSEGWWNCIKPADIDGDGDMDFIVGNLGQNTKLKATESQPAEIYTFDADKNGTLEQVITCYTEDGKTYPMVLKHELQKAVPSIKMKFLKFAEYAGKAIDEVFSTEQLSSAITRKATNNNTSILVNEGNFKFTLKALPVEAQYSPVYAIETMDYNKDGKLDILLAGNFYDVLPEVGRYDANYGLVLEGTGKGNFKSVLAKDSGFLVKGQVRKMQKVKSLAGKELIVVAKNNDNAQVFGVK
jgi:enediyne biosynthesis protein E4